MQKYSYSDEENIEESYCDDDYDQPQITEGIDNYHYQHERNSKDLLKIFSNRKIKRLSLGYTTGSEVWISFDNCNTFLACSYALSSVMKDICIMSDGILEIGGWKNNEWEIFQEFINKKNIKKLVIGDDRFINIYSNLNFSFFDDIEIVMEGSYMSIELLKKYSKQVINIIKNINFAFSVSFNRQSDFITFSHLKNIKRFIDRRNKKIYWIPTINSEFVNYCDVHLYSS